MCLGLARPFSLCCLFLATCFPLPACAQDSALEPAQKKSLARAAASPRGPEIVRTSLGPEFHLGGIPFFIHAAAFEYYRIPRDLWELSLERHAALGINTLFLAVPWNWHEPSEGQFDFDGHTHDRRDLRALLPLAAAQGFKLVVSPGPVNSTGWRDSGLPAWLREPRSSPPAEAAARWFDALARELAPLAATRTVRVRAKTEKRDAEVERDIPGPLLFLQFEGLDSPELFPGNAAPAPLDLSCAPFRAAIPGVLCFDSAGAAAQDLVTSISAALPAPADDPRPTAAPGNSFLMASRLLLSRGVKGWSYSPAQDAFTPAGYVPPGRNRHHRFDAALDAAATPQHASRAVRRNGALLELWGSLLASTHPHPDAGLQSLTGSGGEPPGDTLRLQRLISSDASGRGLLSLSNLDTEVAFDGTLEIHWPLPGALPRPQQPSVSFPVLVPPGESLLLPLHHPLCSAAKAGERCSDEVVAAGAELLRVEREGKTLELTFYTRARAAVLVRLARQPGRVSLDETKPESEWTIERNLLRVIVPRGASPDFLRTLKVHLPYTPSVPKKPDPDKVGRRDFEFSIADAVRLPLSENSSLPSYPPLLLLPEKGDGKLVLQATNYDLLGRDLSFKMESPVEASSWVGLDAGETRLIEVKLENPSSASAAPAADGLFHGNFEIKSGRTRRTLPIRFARIPEEGVLPYQFDFDRDAQPEWVLESKTLRLISDPADSARTLALVEKASGQNLTTSVGLFRDVFLSAPSAAAGPCRAQRFLAPSAKPSETALRLDCDANGPEGYSIRKTHRLTAADRLETEYRISRPAAAPSSAPAVRFEVWNSFPAVFTAERGSSICWQSTVAVSGSTAARKCESLASSASSLAIPAGVSRVELLTPGRAGIAIEFSSGRMTFDKKPSSVLARFALDLTASSSEISATLFLSLLPPD